MIERLKPKELWLPHIERPREYADMMEVGGRYGLIHMRKGKVIGFHEVNNLVTNVGKAYMLNGAFNTGTQYSTWYLGLISGATTPTLSATDTMSSHSGWQEFVTYTASTRQSWGQSASSGNTVTGASAAVFTIGTVAANTYVNGGFLVSDSTLNGTTGLLWSEGLFTNPVPVQTTDVFKLGYLTGL